MRLGKKNHERRLPAGVLPPLVTPFEKDRFCGEALRENVSRLNSTGLAGYVVLGSNGESVYLDDDEALQVVETVAESRGPDMTLVVGSGRESTRQTVEFSRRAAAAGADAVLVVPPSYYRGAMNDSALEFHFRSVADALEIPVLLYHVPKFAPVTFSPTLVVNLSSHPNIAGMKDTSGDMVFLGSVLRECPESFQVFVGTASALLPGLALGAVGGILALANVAPELCVSLHDLVTRGDLDGARKLQYRLLPVNQAVTARFGIAGLKHALDLLGFRGGEPRRPLEPLSRKQQEELARVLEGAGLPVAQGSR